MGLLKGQFDSSHTISGVQKQDVLDRAHPTTQAPPRPTEAHAREHTAQLGRQIKAY